MQYIFTPYQAALDAKLITELTTRRVNNDKTVVILHDRDYDHYNPMIKVTDVVTGDDGEEVDVSTERYAESLEEKAESLGATIMTKDEALKELTKPGWQEGKEE